MLQKPLDQGNVIIIVFVNLCCVPLAEAVGADSLEAKVIADDGKLFLDCPFGDGEDAVIAPNAIAQTIVLNVLLDHQRDSKHAAFACLLLDDLQAVAVPILHDIRGAEAEDVADPQG